MNSSDYSPCQLCPRQCSADRWAGTPGVCGETGELRIASVQAHMGEEPFFSGSRGSGTIFFAGCPCHCVFCQNWQISRRHGRGEVVSEEAFYRIAQTLIQRGVHNLNFVTPDHFWPHIENLCRRLRAEGVDLPFLFNSSGYQLPDIVTRYAEWIDIFLPDFKFADPQLAKRVMNDERYPEIALSALTRMIEAKGVLSPFDPSGDTLARRGVLVRHLVLPGNVENSRRVLDLLRLEFGRRLPISLMSQYTPVPNVLHQPPFHRKLATAEYQAVLDHALDLGFENILIQQPDPSGAFLPDFEQRAPFRGNTPDTP
jgi:putative pyruvate formate lyase activating enzyme